MKVMTINMSVLLILLAISETYSSPIGNLEDFFNNEDNPDVHAIYKRSFGQFSYGWKKLGVSLAQFFLGTGCGISALILGPLGPNVGLKNNCEQLSAVIYQHAMG